MRTNDRFGRAEPDVAALAELAALQLLPRLNEGLVITQGFIGSENKGRTTTLGRGGSDYTAALLAEALHASRVDIWTDVPGIYTTDPRVVSAAKRIDEIAFAEAAEMATFGAKVLHPATLLPAVRSDIPVFVGSSKDPRAGGTLVCNKTENPPLFRALALRRNQTLLTLHSLNMLHSRGFLAEVFGILARHNISVDLITTSEVSVALTLDTTGSTSTGDTLLTQSLLMELSALCRVEVEEGLALVALIGNDLSKACGVGKEVFGVLEPFNIRMICYGASSHNLCFLVPGEDAEQVRASTPPIHAWFLQQNALMKSRLPKRQRWQLLVQKYCIRQRCYPQYAAISRSLSAPAKTHAQVVRWCAIKLKIRRCSARWRFVAIRLCSLCTA